MVAHGDDVHLGVRRQPRHVGELHGHGLAQVQRSISIDTPRGFTGTRICLTVGAPPFAAAFERVFATPHGVDLAALCAASGTAYQRVHTRAELAAALADRAPGLRVLEARVGRADRRDLAARIGALVADLPAPASPGSPGGMP